MRTLTNRLVALVAGVVTVGMPAVAAAEEKPCNTYFQVKSNATGGDWVGGILFSEGEKEVKYSFQEKTTVTIVGSGETEIKFPVGSASAGGSVTTTKITDEATTVGGMYNIGVYKMNDGSTWFVNCDTGLQIGQVG